VYVLEVLQTAHGTSSCFGFFLFKGFAAGQNYYSPGYSTNFGGAANMICLPSNPELSNITAPGGSFIYGTTIFLQYKSNSIF
jgi:hypothetical protein